MHGQCSLIQSGLILTVIGAALAALTSVGDLKGRNQSLAPAFKAFIAANRSSIRKMLRNHRQRQLDE